jgi:hypothetical protein
MVTGIEVADADVRSVSGFEIFFWQAGSLLRSALSAAGLISDEVEQADIIMAVIRYIKICLFGIVCIFF